MDWFYAKDGERIGPLSESSLEQRLATGEIAPETLVWCRGMGEWAPLATVRSKPVEGPPRYNAPADPRSRCQECEALFPADELIRIGGRMTCGGCKPFVLQKLQEGLLGHMASEDAWRDGSLVKTGRHGRLPPRCIQCNRPAMPKTLPYRVFWSPPLGGIVVLAGLALGAASMWATGGEFGWIAQALVFGSLGIGGLTAAVAGWPFHLGIGICPEHARERFWLGTICGLVCLVGGLAAFTSGSLAGAMLGGSMALGGAVTGIVRGSLVTARKADATHVWLKGAGKPFLDSLPEWPGE